MNGLIQPVQFVKLRNGKNMNLKVLLRAFGINITDEQIRATEEIIPLLPVIVRQTVTDLDQRLRKIEENQCAQHAMLIRIMEQIERTNDARRPASDGNSHAPVRIVYDTSAEPAHAASD